MRAALALIVLAACAAEPPRAAIVAPCQVAAAHVPPVAAAAPVAVAPPPTAGSSTGDPQVGAPDPLATPEPLQQEKVRRQETAVLFFAPPAPPVLDENDLVPVTPAWFMPIVCVHKKVARHGAACGDLVPPRAKVRASTGRELTLVRGGGLKSMDGDHVSHKTPYAPACCMYNGCQGKTMPFAPVEGPFVANRPALAIWPADADIGLVTPVRHVDAAIETGDRAALDAATGGDHAALLQGFEVRGRRYATTEGRLTGGSLLRKIGSAWTPLKSPALQASRAALVFAATDVDADGKNELLVFGVFANDHSVSVVIDDRPSVAWEFSCGNI